MWLRDGPRLSDGDAVYRRDAAPADPPGPDFDATLLLLDAASHHYDVAVDTTELEERSEEVHRYCQEYADRVEALADRDDQFEDRMFM